jgi:CubicO group peptidase (beta-lactamase class C family)
MDHTSFMRDDMVKKTLATGYINARAGAPPKPVADTEIVVAAAGSVFSTTSDMSKYMEALLRSYHNANSPLPFLKDPIRSMWTPQFSQFVSD